MSGWAGFFLFSCGNNAGNIPFPENFSTSEQPRIVPLDLGIPKKLVWDTARTGGVRAVTRKLDIHTLPSIAYDSTGFHPVKPDVNESHFDWNALPATPLDLDSLPAHSLEFKTSVLTQPPAIKIGLPTPQKGKPLSIADLGSAQGLNAKFITCVLKDRAGILWIASAEGIFRYDGEYARLYLPGPVQSIIAGMVEDLHGRIWYIQHNGLGMIDPGNGHISYSTRVAAVNDNISKLSCDQNGLIWASDHGARGVSIINTENETYKSISLKNGLSDSTVFEVMNDKEHRTWITTNNGGLDIIDPVSHTIRHLKHSNGLSSDTLNALTQDSKGTTWISAADGSINKVDLKSGVIRRYPEERPVKNNITLTIVEDRKGRLWIARTTGLRIFDPATESMRFISQADGLAGIVTTSILPVDNDRVWVGTTLGLSLVGQNGETAHPLGTTYIVTMTEDTDGNIWAGTDHGIFIMDQQKKQALWLNQSNGLGHNFIQSFAKFKQEVWTATNGGLDIIDAKNKTIEHTGRKEGLVSDTIYSVFRDNAGNIWLTGPANGIDLIDSSKTIIRHTSVKGGLSDNNIQDVKQDQKGRVWVAANKKGVNIIDLQAGTVQHLTGQPGLKDTCNKMMTVDADGRIWIGTDKGIYVADIKQNKLITITMREGLKSNRIYSLLPYKGSVVANTGNNLSIVTPPQNDSDTSWTVAPLTTSEILSKEQTGSWSTDLVSGKGQYFWGDRGLILINDIKSDTDAVATYVTGITVMTLPQHFVNRVPIAEKDTLWARDSIYLDGQTPVNTGYTVAREASWDSVTGPYNMPVNLQLSYKSNYIQLQFSQVHISRTDTVWYSYLLEGIDKNWSSPTTELVTENYLNLPPGDYIFKVVSKIAGGRWGNPAIFSFSISPPWYQTWWAYTLFALAGIAVLRLYIVYRSRQLQKENKLLEEKVSLRTNQLQQSIEDLKAAQNQLVQSEKMASLGELTAGIAHEIQNPLNFVNNFSEVNAELITEMKDELTKGNIDDALLIADDIEANERKISQHGKRADAIVKGMLQHSRNNNGVREPANINALADEYLRLAFHGLRAKDKTFNATMQTDFDESIGPLPLISQDMGRVLLNLFTNAFYTVAEKKKTEGEAYKPTVWVSTLKKDDIVEIRVKDNGNGIPQKIQDKIFQPFFTTKPTGQGTGLGLSLSYDIIKAHGGRIKVETKEKEGSEFIITLPAG